MIDSILSENNDFLIKEDDLKKFYNDNISFFTRMHARLGKESCCMGCCIGCCIVVV